MELKVFEVPGKEWDDFASRYTDLIFYQSVWSEVLRKGLGGQPLYFCLKEGGDIVAGLPGVLLDFKVFRIFYASIPYGNTIGEREFFPPLTDLAEKELRRRGIDQCRMTESPFSPSYPHRSDRLIPAKCSLLDLRPFGPEKGLENYRGEVRRAVRKARKNGLIVKGTTSPEEIEVFHRLYLASMDRNRTGAKYPLRWFQVLYETLMRQGKADIRFAVKGDQYAAGVVLVYSPSAIHYLHNGSDLVHLENRPNDLIVDDIIRKGMKEGKTVLDFMGSDRQDAALLRFKEKWGSQSIDIRTFVRDFHPLRCFLWETGKAWMASRLGGQLLKIFRK
jgi:lipid II:glycine glycyltransferase (peptidoglycan interpeptide bridge formation enzyme)